MKPDTQVVGPVQDTGADVVPLPALPSEQVRQFIRASKAENTLRGYSADWRDFLRVVRSARHIPLAGDSRSGSGLHRRMCRAISNLAAFSGD